MVVLLLQLLLLMLLLVCVTIFFFLFAFLFVHSFIRYSLPSSISSKSIMQYIILAIHNVFVCIKTAFDKQHPLSISLYISHTHSLSLFRIDYPIPHSGLLHIFTNNVYKSKMLHIHIYLYYIEQ